MFKQQLYCLRVKQTHQIHYEIFASETLKQLIHVQRKNVLCYAPHEALYFDTLISYYPVCVCKSSNCTCSLDSGNSTVKDIGRSSIHTILAACGLEHRKNEAYFPLPQPSVCSHIELMAGGQTSLMKGCCSSCFDSFVGDVVKMIMDTRMPSSSWLTLGL